jgi:hypothetical protein
MLRILGLAALVVILARSGDATAEDKHHDGANALGNKLNTNGRHHIATHAGHEIHAHAKGGKVHNVTAHRGKNAFQATKKLKTSKKVANLPNTKDETHLVSATPEDCAAAIAFIGFAFQLGDHLYIFWFPIQIADVNPDDCQDYDA